MGGGRLLLPAAARRTRRRARARDAVDHAGAGRPARGARRAWRAARRSCARSGPSRTGATSRSPATWARSPRSSTRRRSTRAPPSGWRRATSASRLARHATWTSAATHPILPLLATAGGVRLQLATGIAAHRARSATWGGGLWLPECAHAPWLDPLLEEAGAHATCVDLTDVLGRGAEAHLRPLRSPAGPLLAPIDRALLELVWSDGGYPARGPYRDTRALTEHRHQAWSVDGPAYEPGRARRAGAGRRAGLRRRAPRRACAAAACAVVAFDTELLGLHWHEGVTLAGGGARRGRAHAGLRIAPLDALVAEQAPGAGPAAAGRRPGARRARWRRGARPPRAASPGASARPSCARSRPRPTCPTARCASCSRCSRRTGRSSSTFATAGEYPAERAAGHAAAFDAALAAPDEHAPALRNLAPHLARGALASP